MTKTSTCLVIALLALLLGLITKAPSFKSKNAQWQPDATAAANQGVPKLRVVIPESKGEIFFRTLDEFTTKAGLSPLRTVVLLNADDLEVRFWFDGFPYRIDGIILRRLNNQWSATRVHGKEELLENPKREELATPKSGWDEAWGKLVGQGILTLPDSSEVKCESGVLDGITYIVETNLNQTYRIYSYGNPQFASCNEAKRITSIGRIIIDEFGFEDSPK